jgi:hypothetical protein
MRFRRPASGNGNGVLRIFWAYLVRAAGAIVLYAAIGIAWS